MFGNSLRCCVLIKTLTSVLVGGGGVVKGAFEESFADNSGNQ